MNSRPETLSPPTDRPNHDRHQQEEDDTSDWEEWDGRSPFWIHCVAGSLAGVVEHTAVYPLDTVRTHIQVCAACLRRGALLNNTISHTPSSSALWRSPLLPGAHPPHHPVPLPVGLWQTIRYLMNEPALLATAAAPAGSWSSTTTNTPYEGGHLMRLTSWWQGWLRLWRGVQVIMMGCIPAHALYFSSYEAVKWATSHPVGENRRGVMLSSPVVSSSLAGAAAVLAHDVIMTPLDTMKQRLQLGHYPGGVTAAFRHVVLTEGWPSLYRSLPITLATNVPYGMVMVSTHEFCKQAWASPDRPTWQTVLAASSVAGWLAATVTTPLDRVKTALQTQEMAPACLQHLLAASSSTNTASVSPTAPATTTPTPPASCPRLTTMRHANGYQAMLTIWQEEGLRGFFRGWVPRMLSHTPAVAISWTTYELTKKYLLQQQQQQRQP